jgi:hypothetical protein
MPAKGLRASARTPSSDLAHPSLLLLGIGQLAKAIRALHTCEAQDEKGSVSFGAQPISLRSPQ